VFIPKEILFSSGVKSSDSEAEKVEGKGNSIVESHDLLLKCGGAYVVLIPSPCLASAINGRFRNSIVSIPQVALCVRRLRYFSSSKNIKVTYKRKVGEQLETHSFSSDPLIKLLPQRKRDSVATALVSYPRQIIAQLISSIETRK
jgi:hypothetical protein